MGCQTFASTAKQEAQSDVRALGLEYLMVLVPVLVHSAPAGTGTDGFLFFLDLADHRIGGQ